MISRTATIVALLATAAGASLSGCAEQHSSPHFGVALRQDLAAQVADPDKIYPLTPVPTDGARTALAQDRYQKGKVITPVGSASSIGAVAAPTLP